MKKSKLLALLVVFSSFVVSCTKVDNSNTSSSLASSTSSANSDVLSSENNEPASSSSSSAPLTSVDPATSKWSEEIIAQMKEILGGNVLPYVDLNSKDLETQVNENNKEDDYRTSLSITGGVFIESILNKAVSEFEKYSWTVVNFNNKFYATSDTLHLAVTISKNASNLVVLQAWYNEPFDNTALTDWKDITKAQLKEYFGTFDIPFVYLGTTDYKTSYQDGILTITGGIFDEQVYTLFKQAYEAKGFTVGSKEDDNTVFLASKVVNGSTINVSLSEVNNKASLTVSLKEVFNKDNQIAWSTAINKEANSILNGEELPYVYLGTTYPTINASRSNTRQLVIKGGIYDDSILSNFKSTFTSNGYTISDDTATEVKVSKVVNNSTFYVKVEKVTNDQISYPQLTLTKVEAYDKPTDGDYTKTIKDAFKASLNEDISSVLPYIYLGTKDLTFASDPKIANRYLITGGAYDERILTDFDSVINQDNSWVVADTNSGSNYETSKVLRVALKSINGATYKVSLFYTTSELTTTYLEITKSSNISSRSEWSNTAKELFTNTLGEGIEVPFFDTNVTGYEVNYNPYGDLAFSFNTINSFNYRLLNVYEAFKKANYTVSLFYKGDVTTYKQAFIHKLTATKTLDDGRVLEFTFNASNRADGGYYMAGLLNIKQKYDLTNNKQTAWPKTISDKIKTSFGSLEIPSFYLGTDLPYVLDSSNSSFEFRIVGGSNDSDQPTIFLADIEKALQNTSFTKDASSTTTKLVAKYKNANNDVLTLTFGSFGSPARFYLDASLVEGYNPQTYTYDQNIIDVLNKNLNNNTFPNLYLGSKKLTYTEKKIIGSTNVVSLVGGKFSDELITFAQDVFKGDSFKDWKVNKDDSELNGYKILSDDSTIRFELKANNNDLAQLDIYYDPVVKTVDTEPTSWEDLNDSTASDDNKLTKLMNDIFLGESVTPFIYNDSQTAKEDLIPEVLKPRDVVNYNRRITLQNENAIYNNYMLVKTMKKLQAEGFEVTYDPVGNSTSFDYYLPSLKASKTLSTGSKFNITYESYSAVDANNNGWDIYIGYLPSYDKFNNITSWSESTSKVIKSELGDLPVPYVNLGVNEVKIQASKINNMVTITAYNLNDTVLANLKAAYEKAGWSTLYFVDVNDSLDEMMLVGRITYNNKTYMMKAEPIKSGNNNYLKLTIYEVEA